ncbi:MAG: Uma2 family endonuclease [Terricaulis sp.]
MASPARTSESLTIAAFLDFIDRRPGERWELIDGQLVMMTGGTARHDVIAGNILAALHSPMRRRGCSVYKSDTLVGRAGSDHFTAAPDVFVRCGSVAGDERLVTDPVAIVEVLSKTTEAYDRAQKFIEYVQIESLQHYVLVHQDEARAEVWTRDAEGVFQPETVRGLDGDIPLPALEAQLPMRAVYAGTDILV